MNGNGSGGMHSVVLQRQKDMSDAALYKDGPLGSFTPIFLLVAIILVARWLTRRPRREADGRWPWR